MINLEQVGVHLPQGYLFSEISLQLNRNDKIGLAGKNGAGKSTMLKLLAGWNQPSEGKIHKPKDCKIGFLTQDIHIDDSQTVFDYLKYSNEELNYLRDRIEFLNNEITNRTDYESESYLKMLDELNDVNHQFIIHEGFQWEEKIASTLEGLGFQKEDFQKKLSEFSGGWKMRAELAKILVNKPDVILLDEPTNHLDIISIAWLENYLQKFDGLVIAISHDRLFLDNVTKRTIELMNGKAYDYPYSYSQYKIKREEELDQLGKAKKQQDKEIKQTKELIDKYRAKASKAAFAQSLIKKLERTEIIEIDNNSVAKMRISFPLSVQPGKWVLELHNLGKTYGEKTLFKAINITVGRGEKIALLGPNGIGKSTLLKLIMKQIEGEGVVELGHNVNITYFAQDQAEKLNINKTVFETVDDIATGENRKDLRSILGAFLFSGEDTDKKVGVLSGGERTRLALCQLLLSPSNLLILDEPTNHLDIQSKEVLKKALIQYEGTFIIVSHDREFLDGLTNRIWDIENKTLKIHHFDVKEYLQKKMASDSMNAAAESKDIPVQEEQKTVPADSRELRKQRSQIQNKIKKSEEAIEILEQKVAVLETEMADIDYSDEKKSSTTLEAYQNAKKALEEEMLKWEELVEQSDELGAE
ncbi:MAG: ABC-F family ATP-binding cassette domain-containing protein [Flavobacteriia bacterium]|nr:ABC-F family ATP-binding cassette domain-containing protein [Flavobacteriia bacterium]OJX39194.1 MAG: hypothetical protein BGO87_04210 [Flavobacteriia bacterium 40-80]